MKEITAIIQPHTLTRVMYALHALPHFPGVTLLDGDSRERLHKRNRQLNQAYDQAYDSSTSGTSCAHDATDSPRKTRRSGPAPNP